MRKCRYLLTLVLILFTVCSCEKDDTQLKAHTHDGHQYVLCVMDAETGAMSEQIGALQTDEKLDIPFLVKKVAERLGTDVVLADSFAEGDRFVIVLADNAHILQRDSVKLDTAFFTSVAKTVVANGELEPSRGKAYIEFRANAQVWYIYDVEAQKLVAMNK